MAGFVEIHMTDNSSMVLAQFEQACKVALEACGQDAEGFAKDNLTSQSAVGTGALRDSITHKVNDKTCNVGTDSEYGAYVELGTGIYCTMGGGTSGWWVYVPGGGGSSHSGKTYDFETARKIMAIMQSEGIDAHISEGRRATPFLKPAIEEHASDYQRRIEDTLKG